jgi:predicted AAA+ superfamily ATPase
MIERNIVGKLENALANMPVVALLGPRQVGKTTLAFEISKKLNKQTTYLDLESDSDFNKLSDPESYFKRFNSVLIIIDEVNRIYLES